VPTGKAREAFSAALRDSLKRHAAEFGPDDLRRLEQNPLRLFDSKNPAVQEALKGAPRTLDFLDEGARAHHEELKRLLPSGGVEFEEDASLVRGLDYYTLTVFEVTSSSLGAQDALLGGGRYDDLFSELGGPPLSAVGFAIGEDRLLQALPADVRESRTIFCVIPDSHDQFVYALEVANQIREAVPGAVVETDFAGKGIVRGLGRAGQILAGTGRYPFRVGGIQAVLLGVRESEADSVTLKDLATGQQQTFPRAELSKRLAFREQGE